MTDCVQATILHMDNDSVDLAHQAKQWCSNCRIKFRFVWAAVFRGRKSATFQELHDAVDTWIACERLTHDDADDQD